MATVTIVCTSHHERGACTEDALLVIVRGLDPDVVFLEMRPSDVPDVAPYTLEGRAVSRYAAVRRCRRVAVDDFAMPPSFHGDTEALFDYVEQSSDEFVLCLQQRDSVASFGFEAINSRGFEELADNCDRAMEGAVRQSRNQGLIRRHDNWISLLRRRDDAMVSGIYEFGRVNADARGVFLVGAAHLSSLVKRIEARIEQEPNVIRWDIWSRPGRFGP